MAYLSIYYKIDLDDSIQSYHLEIYIVADVKVFPIISLEVVSDLTTATFLIVRQPRLRDCGLRRL